MSTQTVNRGVNVFIETGEAQKAYDRLIAKQKTFTDELKTATNPARIKTLNTELAKLEEPISRAAKKLSGELKPSLTELGNTVKKLSAELRTLSANDPNFEKKVLQLRQANLAYTQQLNAIKGLSKEQDTLLGKTGAFVKSLAAPIAATLATERLIQNIVEFGQSAIEEFQQAEREASRFQNTIEAAGASNALPRLEEKIQSLADRFKFLDNDEIKGVFSQLITYGKLTEQQITTLIPVIADLYAKQRLAGNSQATLAESTDLVIKALEGNSKGLKEYGINIKDAGNTTERFGVVMDQLAPKLKGASETFSKTLPGSIQQTRQEINDLKEDIGGPLTSITSKFQLGWLNGIKGIIIGLKALKQSYDDLFLSRTELQVRDQVKRNEELFQNANKFAAGIIEDAATKPIPAQEKLLKSYGALLKAQRENFDLLEKSGKLLNTKEGYAAQRNVLNTAQIVIGLNEQLKRLRSGQTLGINNGDGNTSAKTSTPAKNFTLQDEEAKLADRIQKVLAENSDIFTKKITEINIQLDELLRGAKKKLDAYLADENTTLAQRNAAQKEYDQLYLDANAQRLAEIQQQLLDADKQSELALQNHLKRVADEERRAHLAKLEAYMKQQEAIAEQLAKYAKNELGELRAEDELNILKSRGKERLNAIIKQLRDESEIKIKSEGLTGKQRKLEEEKTNIAIYNARIKHISEQVDKYAGYIQTVTNLAQTFFDATNAKAQAEIDNDKSVNETKKKQFQSQLDKKLISQSEYNRKVGELDKQVAKKERDLKLKQFNQQKITSIATATINGAEAFTKALTAGPVIGPILAGLNAALTLVQIALIAKQKPAFAKGGFIPSGARHSEGGIQLVDSRSGSIRGEIEGGEPILSRETYRNNKSVVDALLYNSMNRGGAPLNAAWKSAPVAYMNFPAIQNSIGRRYASGGIAPGPGGSSGGPDPVQMAILQTLGQLNQQLAAGIRAGVSLTDFETQQARKANIKNDATAA